MQPTKWKCLLCKKHVPVIVIPANPTVADVGIAQTRMAAHCMEKHRRWA